MAKHLNNYMADTGGSDFLERLWGIKVQPKHAAPTAESEPTTYNDAWSGNPDTDKYWSK